jgi:hypothetical protein
MFIEWFDPEDGVTGVPYVPAERADSKNHGFFHLKRQPELLDSVPELQDAPALKRFVQVLNHQESIFWSIGCEKRLWPPNLDAPLYRMVSYTDLAFDEISWCTERNFKTLFHRASAFFSTGRAAVIDAAIEMNCKRAYYAESQVHALLLTIRAVGMGRTSKSAISNWEDCLALTAEFVNQESRLVRSSRTVRGAGHSSE